MSALNRYTVESVEHLGREMVQETAVKKNWLVVANSARARVLEVEAGLGQFTSVADLVHPQSRIKGVDLGDDRPGHVEGQGHGLGSAAYVARTDPHTREQDRFAREVAACVNDGVANGRCVGVTLVASDPFMGRLKSHLSQQARKLVLRTFEADYTTLHDAELAQRLLTHG
ncbi:host attachment protein [Sphaerotilus microaerophilus]|uniref:host attachment protein n=1 Tax=Sphaerotilus microaerophilus TaxID=2914710 RepID=UPI0020743A1D|nr:host attachment protein [Sphaerotilus sp. FB-5]